MHPFRIWAASAALLLAGGWAGSEVGLSSHPKTVLVALDASHPMAAEWEAAGRTLDALADGRHVVLTVASEKGVEVRRTDRPSLSGVRPYAPRDLAKLAAVAAAEGKAEGTADERILVTNADASEVPDALRGWRLVRPGQR